MRLAFLIICVALLVFVVFVANSYSHFTPDCKGDRCKRHVVRPHAGHLDRMHACEAGSVGWFRDGPFDGGLQFHPSTWDATGSRYAFAFQAPILEQKYRAVIWASRIGWQWRSTAGWPRCG